MSSRVLVIGVNSKYVHTNLAIRYFRENAGCDIFECSINDNIFDVYSKLLEMDYEIFAFSVYIWNRDFCCNLIKMIKASKDVTIIAGGPEASFGVEDFFALCPQCDGICSQEGESTFIALEKGVKLQDAPNMIFKNHKTECVQFPLERMKFPYKKEDLNNAKILYFETSRGCIFNCSYCLSSAMGKTRYFTDEYVFNGIDFFIENNVPLVKLVDRTFNDNDERCCKILEYIINHSKNTRFHFEIAPMLITKRFISLCKKAGNLIQLEIGIQTVNHDTMKAINRIYNLDKVRDNILKIPKTVHTHIDIIAGLPFDTKDTIKDAFNYVYSLNPNMLQLGFLKILKGTKMSESSELFGIKTTSFPPFEILSNNTVSAKEMKMFKLTEKAVDRIYNSGAFKNTVKKAERYDMYSFFEKIGIKLFELEYDAPLSRSGLYSAMLKILGAEYKEVLALDFLENNKKAYLPKEFTDEIPNIKELHNKMKKLEQFNNKKIRLTACCGKTYVICEDGYFDVTEVIL